MQLLNKVRFCEDDELYILGDIIDRGPGTEQVFEWVYKRKDANVHMCIGNHELLFCEFVHYLNSCETAKKIMKKFRRKELDISWVLTSDLKAEIKEELLFYYNYRGSDKILEHDKYGTIEQLIDNGRNIKYLNKMSRFFQDLPYYFRLEFHDREFYLVHAFISEPPEECDRNEMVWSRAYPDGKAGIPGKVIIFGHTPTVSSRYQERGNVILDRQGTAITVNIDCGCCWRKEKSKLALLRLEDLKIFYSNIQRDAFVADV
jgi:serine/threonine protein phosphatase 1